MEPVLKLTKNARLGLTVESFGAEGEGVCRHEGMAVFVPRALPGERIIAQITRVEKRYAFARAMEILSASPDRVTPACPYARQCGGCTCQHMAYGAQLAFKRSQAEGCMRHIAGLSVPVQPVLGMQEPWHYRNKIAVPVSGTAENPLLGYYAPRSHRVVDVQRCLIAREEGNQVIAAVRRWMCEWQIAPYDEATHKGIVRHVMMRASRAGEVMAVLVINARTLPREQELIACLREGVPGLVSVCMSVNMRPDNVILGDSYRVLWGQERLRDTLCGNAFLLSPLSFFQVNPEQTERLYRTALDFAQLRGDETVADVYCGAGTITLMLARHAARVIGIEIVPDAIRDAKENARLNGVENAQFYCGAAEDVLPELVRQGLRPDVIVLDPPRKGADEAVLRAIAVAQPARVVYISCNPATQARDAKILCAMGYAAQRCQPVDMFCQTAGVENVMLFERQQAAEQP